MNEKTIGTYEEKNNSLMLSFFYWMIFSSFFGFYLSIPSLQSFFMFRVLFYSLLLLLVLNLFREKKVRVNTNVKYYYLFLVIWLFVSYLSIVWSQNIEFNLNYNYFLTKNIILIIMTSYFLNDIERVDKIIKIFSFVFIINVFVALVEIFTGWHLKVLPSYYLNTWVVNAPYTFFQNINDTASYFVLYLPLAFAAFYRSRKPILLFTFTFIVVSFIVISTSSRLNYLVLFMQIIFYFHFFTENNKYRLFKRTLVVFFTLIILFIVLSQMMLLNINNFENGFINEIISLKGFFSDDTGSLFVRRKLIIESLDILFNSGLLGVGAGNIEHSIRTAEVADLGNVINLHNWWLELLGNYGIFIFLSFMVFYLKILKKLKNIIVRTKSYCLKIYAFSIFVSLLSFSLASMSSSSIIQLRYIWILFGFALAIIKLGKVEYIEGVHNEINSYN